MVLTLRNSSNTNVEQQLVYAGSEHGKVIALRDLFQANFDPPVLIFVQVSQYSLLKYQS